MTDKTKQLAEAMADAAEEELAKYQQDQLRNRIGKWTKDTPFRARVSGRRVLTGDKVKWMPWEPETPVVSGKVVGHDGVAVSIDVGDGRVENRSILRGSISHE